MKEQHPIDICKKAQNKISPQFNCTILKDENSERVFFSLFKQDNDRWKTEVTLALFDEAERSDEIIDVLIRKCLTRLLKEQFDISCKGNTTPFSNDVKLSNDTGNNYVSSHLFKLREWLSSAQEPIIVINDRPKSGKTLFIKMYIEYLKDNSKIDSSWWLDFNGGHTNITDFLLQYLYFTPENNKSIIILDNLECCGFCNSQNLLRFFLAFVQEIRKVSHSHVKLIVIQDNKMPLLQINDLNNNKEIFSLNNEISNNLKTTHVEETFKQISYNTAKSKVKNLLLANESDVSSSQKKLLGMVLFFSKYGIHYSFKRKFRNDAYFISNALGLKITSNNEIIGYSDSIAISLVDECQDELKKCLESQLYNNLSYDFLGFYQGYLETMEIPRNIPDTLQIIKHSNLDKDTAFYFKDILNKANSAADRIINIVQESNTDSLFNNHLGEILFAVEALSAYSSTEWLILHTLSKIRNHIRDFYVVHSQEKYLPEIVLEKAQAEGTYKDFHVSNGLDENSIESQIELQNELLIKTNYSGKNIVKDQEHFVIGKDLNTIDDQFFSFYISPLQEETQIDIDLFYKSYILAVLFEIEVNMPKELRNKKQLDILLRKIKYYWNTLGSTIKQPPKEYTYFYPKRIPWVSARMLLALYDYRDIYPDPEVDALIKKLSEYLIKCSIVFECKGEKYRFWGAGTGLWNSALETSIFCTLAVKITNSYQFRNEIEEGIRFIQVYSKRWFDNNLLADGLWAYRVTKLNWLTKNTFGDDLKSFATKTEKISFDSITPNQKNDKSLGESHIAKTYIDIVLDFTKVRINPRDIGITSQGYNMDNDRQKSTQTKNADNNKIQPLLKELSKAFFELQKRKIYYTAKEDDRNSYIGSLLKAAGYICKDQTRQGISEERKGEGQLDILIKDNIDEIAIFEGLKLITNSFAVTDQDNLSRHLKKLLDNYNPNGIKNLVLVSYVHWEKSMFDKLALSYKEYILNDDLSPFKVSNSSLLKNIDGSFLRCYKVSYVCGGIIMYVYHFIVRVAE